MVESAPVRFKDGASYNTMMGGWSRAVGEQFVDWLQPAKGLDWIEVGCGSGAFTDLIVSSVAPRPARDASTRSAQPALQGSRDRSWPICGSPREMLVRWRNEWRDIIHQGHRFAPEPGEL